MVCLDNFSYLLVCHEMKNAENHCPSMNRKRKHIILCKYCMLFSSIPHHVNFSWSLQLYWWPRVFCKIVLLQPVKTGHSKCRTQFGTLQPATIFCNIVLSLCIPSELFPEMAALLSGLAFFLHIPACLVHGQLLQMTSIFLSWTSPSLLPYIT